VTSQAEDVPQDLKELGFLQSAPPKGEAGKNLHRVVETRDFIVAKPTPGSIVPVRH